MSKEVQNREFLQVNNFGILFVKPFLTNKVCMSNYFISARNGVLLQIKKMNQWKCLISIILTWYRKHRLFHQKTMLLTQIMLKKYLKGLLEITRDTQAYYKLKIILFLIPFFIFLKLKLQILTPFLNKQIIKKQLDPTLFPQNQ